MDTSLPPRPADLRPDLYSLICAALANHDENQMQTLLATHGYNVPGSADRNALMERVLDEPAAFLARELGILERPDLLNGLFIAFEDGQPDEGIDYFIDAAAAKLIAQGARMAILARNLDGQPFGVPVPRIRAAFQGGRCQLDYKE